MNIFLWVLQILLALHTVAGAMWKFFNTSQAVPSLKALPHGVWLSLGVLELLFSLGLILPAFSKSMGILAPIAACGIAAEMLLFCAVNIGSSETNYGQMAYWLVVVVICAVIAYGRFVLKPF